MASHYRLSGGTPKFGIQRTVPDLPAKEGWPFPLPGSFPQVVFTPLMRQAGMPKEQIDKVKWVSLKGSAARSNGIVAGTIDATVSAYDPKAVKTPEADILFTVSNKLPRLRHDAL